MEMRHHTMRKAAILLVLITALAAGKAFAAEYAEIPFVPMSPQVMAQGGAFIAQAHGYDSFFYNPAGFSRSGAAMTLAATSAWIYAKPDALLSFGQEALAGTTTPATMLGFMNTQVTTGGIGVGSSAGIGYVGNGLGLGAVLMVDSLLSGPSLLGMTGDLTATVGFIGGLSVPFELLGITFHAGGAIRPMIRIHSPLSNSVSLQMLMAVASGSNLLTSLNSADAFYGAGIGLDLGLIAELGGLTVGVSIRDLGGTQFKYDQTSVSTLVSTFNSQMKFPTGTPVTADQYVIPMDIGAGVALHPDLGAFKYFLDPSVSVEMHDLVGALSGTVSPWTRLHVGAEVTVLSLFSVRAGLNQGYLTFGGGMKLLFLDMNLALFTRELGLHAGDKPNSGATLELAIRW
jgi:hypothetical protein